MTNALRSDSVIGNSRIPFARAGVAVAVAAAVVAASAAIWPGQERTVQAIGEAAGAGGEFHSLEPERILDSRDPDLDVAPVGRKPTDTVAAGTPFEVPVVGVAGLPDPADVDDDGFDDNVLAVVVNITVIAPTQVGYLSAYPAGAIDGGTSVVNFAANSTVPNTAVIRPGVDGEISVRIVSPLARGSADIAIDISGWFSTSGYTDGANGGRGARLIPISPIRAYDSEVPLFGPTTLGARAQQNVPIWGAADAGAPTVPVVPNDENIVGAVVNVTGVNIYAGSSPTHISALPSPVPDGVEPSTSTVNLSVGQVKANLAIVPVGPDGSITLFNFAGEIRLVVDIMGYLLDDQPETTNEGRVIPLTAPFRAFDTRLPEFKAMPLGPARSESWSFDSFVNDVTIGGDWVGDQIGLLGNLTATNLQPQYLDGPVASYMTAYPSPESGVATPPHISNLNIVEGKDVPNMALLRYGGSVEDPHKLQFYNRAGYVDYLLDVYAVVLAADPISG